MAPNADLRPFQILALCSGDPLTTSAFGLSSCAMLGDVGQPIGDLLLRSFDLDDQQRSTSIG